MFRQLFRKRFYFFIPIIIITAWLALHLLPASLSQLLPQSLPFSAPVKTADSKFRTYTRELFRQELSGNTLSLHYTLKNPSTYGIQEEDISLGSYNVDPEASCAAAENALSRLHTFNRRNLSSENQITYDILQYSFQSAKQNANYQWYEEPLSSLTGVQAQFPVLLSEYQFHTRDDIETYFKLLAEAPEYFDSLLQFETNKAKRGLFMSDSQVQAIIKECESFLNLQENNYLYSTFQTRISKLSLSKKERIKCIQKNESGLKKYVFPAYQNLIKGLQNLLGNGKYTGGLCQYPGGAGYYEHLVAEETGSSRSISELKSLIIHQMREDLAGLKKYYISNSSLSSDLYKTQGTKLSDTNPHSILASLQQKIKKDFPKAAKTEITIKYVDKEMEEYLSPAFYMIPAIDDTKNNTIYLNRGHLPDDLSLYTTLAHEGYPGHLYQTTYFAARKPDPIRTIFSFGGYTEGWATYCEMLSYYYAPVDKMYAAMAQKNTSLILGLYSLADIGIHHEGWGLSETTTFFRSHGITDTDSIREIYDLIISDPANYLKYYVGFLEFLELKKAAVEKWDSHFSQQRFHKAVLDVGPAPFEILRGFTLSANN